MSRRGWPPAVHLVELDEAIMAVLRDEAEPMTTNELAASLGYRVADHKVVYHRLESLAKRGKVGRTRFPGRRATFWSIRVADVPTGGRL